MIDNFSKLGWTIPLKNKNAQTVKDSVKFILINAKRSLNLIQRDDGEEIVSKNFTALSYENYFKRYSHNTSLEFVFAEKFNHTIGDIFKTLFLKEEMLFGLMYYPQ